MSTGVIDSFLIALGFETNTAGLQDLQARAEAAKAQLLGIVAVAGAAAAAIGLFTASVAASLDDLGDFAEAEDYSAAKLVELGYAAQMSGSSLEDVQDSLKGANKVIGEAAIGIGRGAATFKKLNLEAKNSKGEVKSFDEFLGEVADKMTKLSRKEGIALAEKLGINRSLVPMLMKGKEAIEALRAEAQAFGSSTEVDFEIAGGFQDSVDRTQFMLKSLGNFIAVQLMPQIKLVIDGFRDWMVVNRDFIRNTLVTALKTVSAVIGMLWDWVKRIIEKVVELVDWLFKFEAVTWLAVAAVSALIALQVGVFFRNMMALIQVATTRMLAFNATVMLIPMIIGAVILALAFLVDEVINFNEGNESFLGDLVKEYPVLLEVMDAVKEGVKEISNYMSGLWDQLEPSIKAFGAACEENFNSLKPFFLFLYATLKMIIKGWMLLAPYIGEVILFLITATTKAVTAIVDAITIIVNAITTVIVFVTEAVIGFVTAMGEGASTVQEVFTNAFNAVSDWAKNKFDEMTGFVGKFADKVSGAVQWVGDLFDSTEKEVGVNVTKREIAAPTVSSIVRRTAEARSMATAPVGSTAPTAAAVLPSYLAPTSATGVAANPMNTPRAPSSTSTQSVSVNAPITINSSDPSAAGKSVREELNRATRTATRNGQSAVAL